MAIRNMHLGPSIKTNCALGKKERKKEGRKDRNALFNYAFNICYLWLCGVRHMVKDHSTSAILLNLQQETIYIAG